MVTEGSCRCGNKGRDFETRSFVGPSGGDLGGFRLELELKRERMGRSVCCCC